MTSTTSTASTTSSSAVVVATGCRTNPYCSLPADQIELFQRGDSRCYQGAPPCDLVRYAKSHSDWSIAQLVGVETYVQLLDSAPGLFEPFPEVRTDGDCARSISYFSSSTSTAAANALLGDLPSLEKRKIAPNLVSTVLVDGDLTPEDMKRLLIRAVHIAARAKREDISFQTALLEIDPRIISLVGSSRSYKSPELSLGEIVLAFTFYTIVAALISVVMFKKINGCK